MSFELNPKKQRQTLQKDKIRNGIRGRGSRLFRWEGMEEDSVLRT